MTTPDPRASGKPYERFQAWSACHELVLLVYLHSKAWPGEERYGLTAQARRAAFSAAANISEGSAKRGPREFRRFLDSAVGSLSELAYTLRLAADVGYLTKDQATELEILRDHASRLTWGLYAAVAKRGRKEFVRQSA
jgi:four helix bundle protein